MSSSDGSPDDGMGTTPAPITAPVAPRRLSAPHNLFTLTEVTDALRLLAVGLGEHERPSVSAHWKNGGSRRVSIEDLAGIVDVEDVHEVSLWWRYGDGSRVVGSLVDRPRAGKLSAEGGPQALAAAHSCLGHLRGLHPQRARLRSFVAGRGLTIICSTLSAVVSLVCLVFLASGQAGASTLVTSITPSQLVVSGIGGVTISIVIISSLNFLQRLQGGTRLARQHEVDQKPLTAEVGVFAAVAGVVVAFLALIVAVIALL